jgi:hypothetical protein
MLRTIKNVSDNDFAGNIDGKTFIIKSGASVVPSIDVPELAWTVWRKFEKKEIELPNKIPGQLSFSINLKEKTPLPPQKIDKQNPFKRYIKNNGVKVFEGMVNGIGYLIAPSKKAECGKDIPYDAWRIFKKFEKVSNLEFIEVPVNLKGEKEEVKAEAPKPEGLPVEPVKESVAESVVPEENKEPEVKHSGRGRHKVVK